MAIHKRNDLLDDIKKQLEQRKSSSTTHWNAVKDALAYLSYLAWHCRKYAVIPTFLDAIRSDIVAALYAFAVGLERSAYLHARSILENLLRHSYFNAHPTSFAIRHFEHDENIQESWSKFLLPEVQKLPHFRMIETKTRESIFSEVQRIYKESSRFVHGSTYEYRSNYEGIGSIDTTDVQTEELGELLKSVGEIGLLLLALVHIGPYLLISQPIRRYMLTSAMSDKSRKQFLQCMEEIPYAWTKHQRDAALQVWRERQHGNWHTSEGLLREEEGRVLLMMPSRA